MSAPELMNYDYTLVYSIKGLTFRTGEPDKQAVVDSARKLRATLTSNLSPFCIQGDRALAAVHLLLAGQMEQGQPDDIDSRIALQVAATQEQRKREFNDGPFLVIQAHGSVEAFEPTSQREFDRFVMFIDSVPNGEIRAGFAHPIGAVLSSFAIAADSFVGFTKVSDTIVFTRGDGKPVYAFTSSVSGEVHISAPIEPQMVDGVQGWYDKFALDRTMRQVLRLLLSSYRSEGDRLRSFFNAWTACEILTNKLFSLYESSLFSAITASTHATVRAETVFRIREVMKDKYRLSDKFAVVACELAPTNACNDVTEFKSAKKLRDQLSHGEEVDEAVLPVRGLRALARRYIQLYIQRRGNGS